MAEPSPGVVVVASARVRPGWPASWLKADGARSPAAEAVREVSGSASCSSWATLDTRASGERRSWGRGVDVDVAGAAVLVCSAESVRGRRLAVVLLLAPGESSVGGAGVCSGRVGFMALWPASVVRARLSRGVLSRMRGGMGRAATHERVQGEPGRRGAHAAVHRWAPGARCEGAVCCEDARYVMGRRSCLPACTPALTTLLVLLFCPAALAEAAQAALYQTKARSSPAGKALAHGWCRFAIWRKPLASQALTNDFSTCTPYISISILDCAEPPCAVLCDPLLLLSPR